MHPAIIDQTHVKAFILAGKAAFTVVNTKTGNRFTFRVKWPKRCPKERRSYAPLYVTVLVGPNNSYNYAYLGAIYDRKRFARTNGVKISESTIQAKAWKYIWERLNSTDGLLPDFVQVWHEGRCAHCGKRLTVPESISRGLGPECAGRVGL